MGNDLETETEKMCSTCRGMVPVEDFHKDRNQPDGLKYSCKDCTKIETKKRYKRHKQTIKATGHCMYYGCKSTPSSEAAFCEYHFYKRVAYGNLKDANLWDILQKLAESQKYICPITGDSLVPGVNMSLDHIKPSSKYPELKKDTNNLQWLSKWANMAKGDLEQEDFINQCVKVSNRNN